MPLTPWDRPQPKQPERIHSMDEDDVWEFGRQFERVCARIAIGILIVTAIPVLYFYAITPSAAYVERSH